MNATLAKPQLHTAKVLDPRLLLRWSYVGRIAITLAIFFAVGFVFDRWDTEGSRAGPLTMSTRVGIFPGTGASVPRLSERNIAFFGSY